MKIKELLADKGSQVYTIQAEATLSEALKLLTSHRIGSLLVMDQNNQIAGLLSERDILRQIDNVAGNIAQTKVKEAMTSREDLVVAADNDDLDYAMRIMTNNRIRHLPVVAQGELCGMVSIGDLIKAQLSQREHENKMLMDYITGKYPA